MRMGEALATCPGLALVEPDPAGVEQAWDGVLRRLEDAGFAVEPVEPGCLYFETDGVERLYGGGKAALSRALAAAGGGGGARRGGAARSLPGPAAAPGPRGG